ncbi:MULTISPECIES: hypothetical protein [unclassified Novosphingobium]|uniref:hypothetical protein n=1 Tax=unclassified Novosphingobium TaxID=2644732 RepID=UPI00135C9560|nr:MULTISPECIES: hypothetical protein [unclassified Novosphingobium]
MRTTGALALVDTEGLRTPFMLIGLLRLSGAVMILTVCEALPRQGTGLQRNAAHAGGRLPRQGTFTGMMLG